jgi:hypothetical protein
MKAVKRLGQMFPLIYRQCAKQLAVQASHANSDDAYGCGVTLTAELDARSTQAEVAPAATQRQASIQSGSIRVLISQVLSAVIPAVSQSMPALRQ